jgi:beta-lactamase regulating signal transducer with metallopeptidase domain
MACGAMAWTSLSFAIFEPRSSDETIGVVLMVFAALAILLVVQAIGRLMSLVARSKAAIRPLLATGTPVTIEGIDAPALAIDALFPVVAVVGLRRPTLIIARSVLDACTPDELGAIVAHEAGHIRRRDNLTRLLMAVTPDFVAWVPGWKRSVAAAWHEAAEDAADDCADALGPSGRLHLAEALLRVVKLAPAGTAPIVLPTSALYRGEDLGRRVRRLLVPPTHEGRKVHSAARRLLTVSAALTACVFALHGIHELVEVAVAFFP